MLTNNFLNLKYKFTIHFFLILQQNLQNLTQSLIQITNKI